MDINSLKKSPFGGYKRKSVHDFLEELSLDNSVKLSALAEEKGKLMDKVAELEEKIKELEDVIGISEKEKDYVASAIVSAEKEAAKILSEAQIRAEEIKIATENELADERNLIKDLRISALQAMQGYKDKLDAVSKRLGVDE